jgi:hypothetical protein
MLAKALSCWKVPCACVAVKNTSLNGFKQNLLVLQQIGDGGVGVFPNYTGNVYYLFYVGFFGGIAQNERFGIG